MSQRLAPLWLFLMLAGLYLSSPIASCQQNNKRSENVRIHMSDLNEEGGFPVKMVYDRLLCPFPTVQASINGSPPLTFIVDTGLNQSLCLERNIAKSLNLPLLKETIRFSKTLEPSQTARIDTLIFQGEQFEGQLSFSPLTACIDDNSFAGHSIVSSSFGGIIGMPLLRYMAVRFDFAAGLLTFFPKEYPTSSSKIAILPLSEKVGQFYVSVSLPNDLQTSLIIDTGCNMTALSETLLKRLPNTISSKAVYRDINGTHLTTRTLLGSMQIADFSEPDIIAYKAAGPSLLGMDVLSRFRCTLDAPHQRLLLERASDYATRVRVSGTTGLAIAKSGKICVITNVNADSLEAKAGIRKGDELICIDGQPASTLSPEIIHHLLEGYADTTAELILKRKDTKELRVTYKRQNVLVEARSKSIGQ